MAHVPFAVVFTVLALALSCVPAVVIWVMYSNLMDSPLQGLYDASVDATDSLANEVLDAHMTSSLNLLDSNLFAGDREMASQESMLYASGILDIDLDPNVTNIDTGVIDRFRGYNFDTMKGNPGFSFIQLAGTVASPDISLMKVAFWIYWQSLEIDVVGAHVRTLYLCDVRLYPDEKTNELQIFFTDQTTGVPEFLLRQNNYSWQYFAQAPASLEDGWGDDLAFNVFSGQVELITAKWLCHSDQWYKYSMGFNVQALSEELRDALATQETNRIFIYFRNQHGHLIAASHGKFFSQSDVDARYVDPIRNPPNFSNYTLYTCLNSTDAFILEACQQLVQRYGSWVDIPTVRLEMNLEGRRFWVGTGYSTSSLNATVAILVDRESLMGPIDTSNNQVLQNLADRRRVAAVVLAVTTTAAGILPILVGVWLAWHMLHLTSGLHRIAKLDFSGPRIPSTICQEIHGFQQSFLKMERGLSAFAQFVPQAVVTQLVAGDIRMEDEMTNRTLTIMFADIEGFSTISETLPPTALAQVCTEYFETMCRHVVGLDGTIDKFIGDCIMALWNAPVEKAGHQRSAVTAALAMQQAVQGLHKGWASRGMPALKFRLGLHTGSCLVGNFGCSYRVSYTCLGDDVNLASRLEALNKKFGTTICVSQSTYEGCREDFRFRHLSKVTVPGRSEVLSVYEVLCHSGIDQPEMVYHWKECETSEVLQQAREYEAAYNSLVEGRYADCKAILRDRKPNKAWQALTDQLERQVGNAQLWDGVLYFKEK